MVNNTKISMAALVVVVGSSTVMPVTAATLFPATNRERHRTLKPICAVFSQTPWEKSPHKCCIQPRKSFSKNLPPPLR